MSAGVCEGADRAHLSNPPLHSPPCSFVDELQEAADSRAKSLSAQMAAELKAAKYLETVHGLQKERDGLIVKNEASLAEVRRMQKMLADAEEVVSEAEEKAARIAAEKKELSKKFAAQGKALKKFETARMQGTLSPRGAPSTSPPAGTGHDYDLF